MLYTCTKQRTRKRRKKFQSYMMEDRRTRNESRYILHLLIHYISLSIYPYIWHIKPFSLNYYINFPLREGNSELPEWLLVWWGLNDEREKNISRVSWASSLHIEQLVPSFHNKMDHIHVLLEFRNFFTGYNQVFKNENVLTHHICDFIL